MLSSPIILTTLGLLFLSGVAIDYIGQHSFIPRGSALILIGFLLGSSLTLQGFKKSGRCVLGISIWVVLTTAAIVRVGLFLRAVPRPGAPFTCSLRKQ